MPAGDLVEFHWEPDPYVLAHAFDGLALGLSDFSEPLAASIPAATSSFFRAFDSHGGNLGEEWKPWAESYRPYAEAFPNIDILRQSEEHIYDHVGSPENFEVTPDDLIFTGSAFPDEIWIWQNEGAGRTITGAGGYAYQSDLPARPFIGVDIQSEEEIVTIFDVWVNEQIDRYIGVGSGPAYDPRSYYVHPTGTVQSRLPAGSPGGAGGRFGHKVF